MDRSRDLPSWPHADLSRFCRVGTNDWHVQETGRGPILLCLHGSGASTHSWRDLLPLWARDWRVVAIDLPGQGFTRSTTLRRCGLDQMTEDIARLCATEGWAPAAIVGHSAGAAIALSLSSHLPGPPAVVGINAALGRFEGVASWAFPLLARLLALNPLTSTIFTLGGPNPARARRLIEGTGSRLDAEGLGYYARLIGDRQHVEATLQMMTQWQIDPLIARLPQIESPTLLIAAEGDLAVPPATSDISARRIPGAEVVRLADLGHLAHEEAPDRVAELVTDFLRSVILQPDRTRSDCR
ncbi:alpha/beta fold hydrolase BchO [Marinibacterium profundimaris]|uniref:Magnesium chelatase n=1 Tax=Marinibacterium profundimaris TaxID=1679460 RepID=A0A225NMK9_9RHOB|nr:alpha/beta fold hydrolase BchO [Marinibacterium profundimaris]OWU72190.1 magnesium chelatase [Marinibacterium profundimaris]